MKKIITMILALVVLFTLAACNTGGSKSDGDLIGVAMPNRTTERWVIEGDIMQAKLEAAGYAVDLQYANDDVPTQVSQVENMITKGAKFLIICSIDGAALSGPLAKAKAAGIPILAYDRLLMETDDVDYFVGFFSTAIGNLMGESLMKGIDADNASADDPLYIELFAGSLDDSNTQYYFYGAMEKIQPYINDGKVVVKSGQVTLNEVATDGWSEIVAQSRMENLLSAHYTDDTLAGVLSPYDGLSLGILAALKAVGYGTSMPIPKITGQDCEPPSLISIWNDEQYSSIYLDFELLAGRASKMAIQYMTGEEVELVETDETFNGVKNVPAYLESAFELTKDNLVELAVEKGKLITMKELEASA